LVDADRPWIESWEHLCYTEPMNAQKIRVILADDHPAVRAGIRQFIERAPDIEVLAEADDGRAALDLIRRYQPDVAVLDLQMPGLSGLEVIAQARQEQPASRFIVLTAYDDDPYIFAALRAGARGYLLKTAGPEELARAIRLVNAGQSALDPSVTERVIEKLGHPTESATEGPERLSERELEVLRLAAEGRTNRAIGLALGISDRTVHSHLINIFQKLGVSTRTEAAMKAVRMGWISPNSRQGPA
jgi:DNA-binding NarL/FixJ family response regulator